MKMKTDDPLFGSFKWRQQSVVLGFAKQMEIQPNNLFSTKPDALVAINPTMLCSVSLL